MPDMEAPDTKAPDQTMPVAGSPSGTRHLVAPELRPWLDLFPVVTLSDDGRPDLAMFAGRAAPPPLSPDQAAVRCEERHIPGAPGAPDVRLLVYTPPGDAALRPAYLHLHGGGFVLGMPEINDASNRQIAHDHGCIVVSVAYRLAPDTRFPGALEDNYAALGWLHDSAAALGVDRARIAIGGESAGGGHAAMLAVHAAMLAVHARDRGVYPICFQLLDSPMLDDRTGSGAAPHPFCGEFAWTAQHNRIGWRALLGVAPGGDAVPVGAVPARAADLAGLPPAFIAVGGLDLFLDEDIEHARRLARAGVPTELHVIPGAFHGFGFGAGTPQAALLTRLRDAALARAFAPDDTR